MITLGSVVLYASGSAVSAVVVALGPKALARLRARFSPSPPPAPEAKGPTYPLAVVLDLSANVEIAIPLSYPFVEAHHGPIEMTFRPIPRTSVHGDMNYEPTDVELLDGTNTLVATDPQYDAAPQEPGDPRPRVNLRPGASVPWFAGAIVNLASDPARFGFKPGEPIRFWGLAQGATHLRGHALFEFLRYHDGADPVPGPKKS